MNQIAHLRAQIDEVKSTIQDVELRARQEDGTLGFADQLALGSLHAFAGQVDQEYREAMHARELEVAEFRLMGEEAEDGSLPLDTLGHFALNLHKGLMATAFFKKTGKSLRRVNKQLQDDISFEMSGLAAGSTRIFVSAGSEVDLFGQSLTEDTLGAAFALFDSGREDAEVDALREVGETGVRRFRDLFEMLVKRDLELEVTWRDPEDQTRQWTGTSAVLDRTLKVLKSATDAVRETVEMLAVVEGINSRGRLELRRLGQGFKTEGPLVKATYFYNDLEKVRSLRIDDVVQVALDKTTTQNAITRRKTAAYFLRDLIQRTDVRYR